MLEEARLAYVRLREFDQQATPATVAAWLENSRDAFPESKRDVVTWRYPHADDAWHTAFTTAMRVERVVVGGTSTSASDTTVIVDRGTTVLVDENEVRAKAAEAAARLHRRMEEI